MKFIRLNKTAFVMIAAALVFIAVGVWRGEAAVVVRRAINVCMECIGLG